MHKHSAVCRFLFLWSMHVLCIALGQVEAQEIEVYVNVPRFTPTGENIYLTGDSTELCHWTPDCVKMKPFSENVYHAKIKRAPNQNTLQLKVNRGSWDKQASDPKGLAWGNLIYEFPLSSNLIVISVENWTDLGPLSIEGKIDEYPQFYSPELNNRRNMHVWTPPDYETNPSGRYQVLYMHDGQNVFDPSTSTFGVPWGVDGAITSLVEKNAIDQTIVVALDCTQNRTAEYDFDRLGSKYADFLINTVKPFIDAKYRTLTDRSHTFVMGSSMGAIISLELLWARSDVFSRAAGLSFPAFFENEKTVKFFKNNPLPKLPIQMYFDHGDFGDDHDYEPTVKRFYESLLQMGFSPQQMVYQKFPFAEHNETAWARRVATPLKFLLKD